MPRRPSPARAGTSAAIVAAVLLAAAPGADASIQLGYFGGPVVSHATVVPVFWNANASPNLQANLPQFYADLVQSRYWDLLAQYSTVRATVQDGQAGSGQLIGRGSARAGIVLVPTPCPASVLAPCTVTEAEIDTEINHQIDLGNLPAPTVDATGHVDIVYMLSFPTNVHVTLGLAPPTSASCTDFCSANVTLLRGATPVGLGIVMDMTAPGCDTGCGTGNGSALDRTTEFASVALVDAVTDVAIGLAHTVGRPLAWYDATNGQVAVECLGIADLFVAGPKVWTVNQIASIPPFQALPRCVASSAGALTIGAAPTQVTMPPGASTAVTISTASGLSQSTVTFSVNTLPAGLTASFLPVSVNAGQSTQLLLAADPAMAAVDVTVDVGGQLSSPPLDLAVTSFALSVRRPDPVFGDGFE